MKRYSIIPLLASLTLCISCINDYETTTQGTTETYDPESIVLTVSTRADDGASTESDYPDLTASEDKEADVNSLDVFIFDATPDEESQQTCVLHQHYDNVNEQLLDHKKASLVIGRKDQFTQNTAYRIFAIANAKETTGEEFSDYDETTGAEGATTASAKTVADLRNVGGATKEIHRTGSETSTSDAPPQCFLMDGEATEESDGTTTTATGTGIVLNDGTTESVFLHTTLRRAGAKIYVILMSKPEKVRFATRGSAQKDDETKKALYNYRIHDRFDTRMMSTAKGSVNLNAQDSLQTTAALNLPEDYVKKNSSDEIDSVLIKTYTYSQQYTTNDPEAEKQIYIVARLPIEYCETTTGEETATWEQHYSNFYKIPVGEVLSEGGRLVDRNHVYVIRATISAPGSEQDITPVEVKDITYQIWLWNEEDDNALEDSWLKRDINVGDDAGASYFEVQKNYIVMQNTSVDATDIYASSAGVEDFYIEDVYYYNKYGIKVKYDKNSNDTTKWTCTTSSNTTETVTVYAEMAKSNSDKYNGYISIYSSVPTNNLIRYFTVVVLNSDGQTEKITVIQYPLDYITFELGWFSYREDFTASWFGVGTTGSYPFNAVTADKTDPINGNSFTSASSLGEIKGGTTISDSNWSYNSNSNGGNNNYGERIRMDDKNDGSYGIGYYYWTESSSGGQRPGGQQGTTTYTYTRSTSEINRLSGSLKGFSPQMYHIYISRTSSEYTLGRPKLDENEVTANTAENQVLVSPSIMMASELGATMSVTSQKLAADHCKQYVEVTDTDPTTNGNISGKTVKAVYDDWRLPTYAEVEIIMKYQETSTEAMQEVFELSSYWCAGYTKKYCNKDRSGTDNRDQSTQEDSDTGNHAIRCVRDVY